MQAELLEPDPGKGAPKSPDRAAVMTASHLTLDGEKIEIKEMNTPECLPLGPFHQDTALVGAGLPRAYVWMADSQTKSAPQQLGQGAGQPAGS